MDAISTNRYDIPPDSVRSAVRCEKEFTCLTNGPACKVAACLGEAEAVMVTCHEPGPCAYKTGHYHAEGVERSLCSCPVRLAFHRLHSL